MNHYFIPLSDAFILPSLNLIFSIKKVDTNAKMFIGNLGLSENNINKISSVIETAVLNMPEELEERIHQTYWPKAYMLKYVLPWLIEGEIDRVLCLGADMLVQKNLDELFSIDLDGFAFAASVEVSGNVLDQRVKKFNDLPGDRLYLNAETLLVNCNYLRENYTPQNLIEEFSKMQDELLYYDQDFINIYFYRKIIPISFKYNYQLREFAHTIIYQKGLETASIVHFSAAPKPWSWKCKPRWIKVYYKLSNDFCKRDINKILIKSQLLYYPYIMCRAIKKKLKSFKT